MTVLIYVDASKRVGDHEHLKVFANDDRRSLVCRDDLEGVAFEYDVLDVKEAANLRAGETYLDQAPD